MIYQALVGDAGVGECQFAEAGQTDQNLKSFVSNGRIRKIQRLELMEFGKSLDLLVLDLRSREVQHQDSWHTGQVFQLFVELIGGRRFRQHHPFDLHPLVILLDNRSSSAKLDHRIGVAAPGHGHHQAQCRNTGQRPPTVHRAAPCPPVHRESAHRSVPFTFHQVHPTSYSQHPRRNASSPTPPAWHQASCRPWSN